MLSDLGEPGSEPASVKRYFAEAKAESDKEFDAARMRTKAGIEQEVKQAGGLSNQAATSEAVSRAMRSIGRGQSQSNASMRFQEANAGLGQTNFLLSALERTGLGLSQGAMGFGNNAIQSGQILSAYGRQNAQAGSTYGSLVGTALGGALGYFAGNPYLGASLGSAAGGAAGGYFFGGG